MNLNPITIDVFQDRRTGAYQVVNPLRNSNTDYLRPPLDNGQNPTTFRVPTEEQAGWLWAPWGKLDRLPTLIREKVDLVPMAGQTMYRLMGAMYGNGLAYYRNEDLKDGPQVQRAYDPVIEQWLRRCRLRHEWLLPQFLGYRYHFNAFSQLIFNRRRDQVTGIYHLDGEFCRKSRQDEVSLRCEQLYYSAEFASTYGRSLRRGFAIPMLDWQTDTRQWLERSGGYKAAWHSHLRTPGTIYYATMPWVGLFRDKGWLDNAAAVPEIVHAMQRNQIMLKYQIMIPMSFFQARYPDWNTYDSEKKEQLMDEITDYIEHELTDTQNAYKSITTFFSHDQMGKEVGKISIEAIDDKIKRDSWVPTSNTADAQIVQGLGMHPSQLGLAPEGGKMGAGSGSDQREAFNTMVNLNTLEQEIVLEPLNWAAAFNAQTDPRWDVTFFIDHTTHTTTNNQEDGLVPSPTTITPQ